MTKSISRSQVRLIASTNAIFGADEACAMLRISRDAMYRLAKDPDDPFPIRYIGGKTRDGIVLHDELVAWVERRSSSCRRRPCSWKWLSCAWVAPSLAWGAPRRIRSGAPRVSERRDKTVRICPTSGVYHENVRICTLSWYRGRVSGEARPQESGAGRAA